MPISFIYGIVLAIRNKLFDYGVLRQYKSSVRTVGVGNLSVGGTGKTPFIAMLIEQSILKGKKVAIISRGYGRNTKGLKLVQETSTASEVGDEPLLLKLKFPQAKVWVSEKRVIAVKEAERSGVDIIYLDDNFQHRYVKTHFQYMLSRYQRPFFKDFVLPAGRLREFRGGAKRADCIVYTHAAKIDSNLIKRTRKYSNAEVKFAQHAVGALDWKLNKKDDFSSLLAVSGIAHPQSFINSCKTHCDDVRPKSYSDHYSYNSEDIQDMVKEVSSLENAVIICTEKDWVKLKEYKDDFGNTPVAVKSIELKMINL